MAGQPQRATEEFRAAAGQTGGEPGLITMARLRAAQSMDLSGKRREALPNTAQSLSVQSSNAHTKKPDAVCASPIE